MPVTARLSLKFYERFGDEIANELVEWFNKVDEQYRTELREQNELNFARFDAKLDQRIAELGAALRQAIAEMDSNSRQRTEAMGSSLRQEMMSMRLALSADIAAQGEKFSRDRESQVRWMVGLWAAQVSLFIGTVFVVLQGR